MRSFLIIGSTEKSRISKIEELIGKEIVNVINNPDFFLLKAEEGESIGIAETRTLIQNLSFKPYREKEKIAIILEAQNLTTEAQNALLKILEEPPEKSKIYLTAPDETWLLSTVVSRCQTISLTPETTFNEPVLAFSKEVFVQILTAPLGEKLKLADQLHLTQKREIAQDFLQQFQSLIRQYATSFYSVQSSALPSNLSLSPQKSLAILKLCSKYLFLLKANCHVSLTIDNFLIEISLL